VFGEFAADPHGVRHVRQRVIKVSRDGGLSHPDVALVTLTRATKRVLNVTVQPSQTRHSSVPISNPKGSGRWMVSPNFHDSKCR